MIEGRGKVGKGRTSSLEHLPHQVSRDVAHQLVSLSAILQLHFRKEEEVLLPVLDASLSADEAAALFARMGAVAHQ